MLYIIHANGTRNVKIGYTERSAEDRLREMQGGCPHDLVVLWKGMGAMDDEARLHRALSEWRRHGEWFTVCEPMLAALSKASSRAVADAVRVAAGEPEYENTARISGVIQKICPGLARRSVVVVQTLDANGEPQLSGCILWPIQDFDVGDFVTIEGEVCGWRNGDGSLMSYVSGRVVAQERRQ